MRRAVVWGLLVVVAVAGVLVVVVGHLPAGFTYTAAWQGRGSPTISADGRTLTVPYLGGDCDRSVYVDQQWTESQVTITIRVDSDTPCDALGVFRTAVVHLDRPLAERLVVAGGCTSTRGCHFRPSRTP